MATLHAEGIDEAYCQERVEIVTYKKLSHALGVLGNLLQCICERFELETVSCPCLNRNKSDLSFYLSICEGQGWKVHEWENDLKIQGTAVQYRPCDG